MKVYQIILNEAGVEPIAGRPGSYRVVYPPEYNMPPEGPLSKFEADKKLKDAEIKFRNQRAQDYLDKKEVEKQQQKEKSKKPEKSSVRQPRTPPPMPDDIAEKTTPTRKPDWYDKAAARWKNTADYDAYVQKTVPLWIGRIAYWMKRLLQAFNLLEPLYTLYSELARNEKAFMDEAYPYNAYEQAIKRGESEPDRASTDKDDMLTYNNMRNYLIGDFVGKYGVIITMHMLAQIIAAVVWGSRVKNVFLYIGAPLTFGTSLIGAVGSQVATAAFIAWLESKEGRKKWEHYAFTEIFGIPFKTTGREVVGGFGEIADSFWQGMKMTALSIARHPNPQFSKEELRDKRKQYRQPDAPLPGLDQKDTSSTASNNNTRNVEKDSKGQGTQNNTTSEKPPKKSSSLPKYPPASQSKVQWPSDVRSWVNGGWNIYGEPVTDGLGFLIPGIEYETKVRLARRWAKSNGYPDPLADLPAAPGQQHPGPFVD